MGARSATGLLAQTRQFASPFWNKKSFTIVSSISVRYHLYRATTFFQSIDRVPSRSILVATYESLALVSLYLAEAAPACVQCSPSVRSDRCRLVAVEVRYPPARCACRSPTVSLPRTLSPPLTANIGTVSRSMRAVRMVLADVVGDSEEAAAAAEEARPSAEGFGCHSSAFLQ